MAYTVSIIGRNPQGNLGHEVLCEIAFTGNYATDGEALNAADFGGNEVVAVNPHGIAMASDEATGVPVSWDPTARKLIFFEGSAAGTALSEKTNAEAYPTGCYLRASVYVR